jgi:hypothetical protein
LIAIVHSPDFGICGVRTSLDVYTRLLATSLATGLFGAAFFGSIDKALAECKPGHLKSPYFMKTMGQCGFDSETLSFRGTPAQQAMCLMRGMDATRNLGPALEGLPPGLAKRVGETTELPSREMLSAYLSKLDLEWDFAAYLWQPISHAHDNDPDAPAAKYFVIHDTSGPFYGHRAFPDDINVNPKVNNLQSFACTDEWGKAHVVVNRLGDMLINHDFSIPWRETKFEQAAELGGALKGLFVHIEMIQPRRAGAGGGDGHSPDPAFTQAQYDRLALLYTIASVRAERWLVPAFHAALDADIPNGHDDPLNFKVDSFADSIDRLMEKLRGAGQFQASNATTTTDAQPDIPSSANDGFWIDALWGTPRKTAVAAALTAADNSPKSNVAAAADSSAAPSPDPNGSQTTPGAVPNPIPAQTAATGVTEKPPNAKVAERESAPPPAQKSTQKPADTEVCVTHRVNGRRHRTCEPDNAGDHGHGTHAVRSADRDVSGQSDGARRHGEDAHPRHARSSSRRHRA